MALPLAHLVCLLAFAAPPESRPLPVVITDLGSPDFTVRELATDELLTSKEYTLQGIELALKDQSLTAEQRLRLEQVGMRLFKDIPHGALGVVFTEDASVAEIREVKQGFPSVATLKAGDVITQIDGEPVTARVSRDESTSSVRALVVSHEPGDEVPMVVLRNGQPVNLKVKFGDFQELNRDLAVPPARGRNPNFTGIVEGEYQAAWRFRLKRNTGRVEPVAIDATALRPRHDNVWANIGPADVIDEFAADRAARGDAPSVVAGASPDHAGQARRSDQANGGGAGQRMGGPGLARAFGNNGLAGRGRGMGLTNPFDPREIALMAEQELTRERLEREQILQSIEMLLDQPAGQQQGNWRQLVEMRKQLQQELNVLNNENQKRKAVKRNALVDQVPVAPVAPPEPNAPDQKADKP